MILNNLYVFVLILTLIYNNALISESKFNNSILELRPWGLDGSCAPVPENCTFDSNNNDDGSCEPMCDESGQCTISVGVILPSSDYYIANIDDVSICFFIFITY